MKKLAVAAALISLAGFGRAEAVTSGLITYREPSDSLLWKTVLEAESEMVLDWPAGATRAELSIVYPDGHEDVTSLEDPTAASCTALFTLPKGAAEETVVEARITYFAAESEIRTDSARLGLVQGVGSGAAIPFKADPSSRQWRKVKGSAVLPLAEDAETLAVDGAEVPALDAPGWFYWAPEVGSHTLTLNGTDYPMESVGFGTMLLLR